MMCDHPLMGNNLKSLREKKGWKIGQAAEAMGMSRSGYQKLERNERQLTSSTIERATVVFSTTYNDVIGTAGTRVVGQVGAGFEAHFYEGSDELDIVETPPGASDKTVAVIVRGDSMRGTADDRSTLYYEDEPQPINDNMIGRLCVLWLSDGRVLVKRPRSGSAPGLFHLESTNADTMFDVPVDGGSVVDWIKPR